MNKSKDREHSQTADNQRSPVDMLEHALTVLASAVVRLDHKGRILDTSESFSAIFGDGRHAGKSMLNFIAESDQSIVEQAIQRAQTDRLQVRVCVADRTLRHATLHTAPQNGNCIIVIAIDDEHAADPVDHAILQRDHLYRALARNLPDTGVLYYDTQLNILIAEGAVLQAMIPQLSNLEGKSIHEVTAAHPELGEHLATALRGEQVEAEYNLRDAIYRVQAMPVHAEHDAIIGGTTVITDITSQRKSADALATSERRLRVLLDTLPDIMYVVDRGGNYIEIHTGDTSAPKISDAAVGTNIRDSDLPPDVIDEALGLIQIAVETGNIQSYEYGIHHDDGYHYYEARLVAVNQNEVLTLVRDITALKHVQEELSGHVEDLTILRQVDGELSDNLNLNYVKQLALDATIRLSKATAGFIALEENDHLYVVHHIGGYDVDVVQEQLESDRGVIAQVVKSGQGLLIEAGDADADIDDPFLLEDSVGRIIIPLIAQDHVIGVLNLETRYESRFTLETFQFVKLITGRIAVIIENARLYQQTEHQLQELQHLYEEVSRLGQLKTDMIRIASHDLKNPLAAIMGYLEMLRWDADKTMNEQQQNYLSQMHKAAQRMQKITTSILSLERIQQMAQNTTDRLFNIGELVTKIINDHQSAAKAKKQSLNLSIPNTQTMVIGDPVQLHEAIDNLVSNAIKYTPEKGTVKVDVQSDHTGITLRVTDNGYGIPEEQQKRLFSPFYRARTTETEEIDGTGLGLHLVKNIINRHHGHIVFESTYGEGSMFGFKLPPVEDRLSSPGTKDDRDVNGSTIVG